ncbi:MAG: phage terminase large subunit [Pseudomonadota bacterium]
MSLLKTRALIALPALHRQRFYPFVRRAFDELFGEGVFSPNWAVRAMCAEIEHVILGTRRRLLITVPPRHLKSFITAVALPAWQLGRDPSHNTLVASYSGALAGEHARLFRRLISTKWYQDLFPHMQIDPRANRSDLTKTIEGGGRKAVGRSGSVTGFGADLIIADDFMSEEESRSETERANALETWTNTFLSRLNDQRTGKVIIIQQRLHDDDLAGYAIAQGNYRHLNLPAIAEDRGQFDLGFGDVHIREVGDVLDPERFPQDVLDGLRLDMGPMAYNAQYQQNPTPPDGNIFRWEWFESYEAEFDRSAYSHVMQSWDTAITANAHSDYSVCLTFGLRDKKWDLIDVFRARLEYPALKAAVLREQKRYQADRVLIEKASTSFSLVQELNERKDRRGVWVSRKPKADKQERAIAQTARLEAGLVRIPVEAPWRAEFKRELLGFPRARHDDQVDSLSQFVKYLAGPGRAFLATDPKTGRRKITRRKTARR